MQERHFEEIYKYVGTSGSNPFIDDTEVDFTKQFVKKVSDQTDNLPDNTRTPNEIEVKEISRFMDEYKFQSPKASKRQIRRATLKKFNLTILPDTL